MLSFLLLELILLTLMGGWFGFSIAFTCIAPPIYYIYKREQKYKDTNSTTANKVGWQNLFGLLGTFVITSLIAVPIIESNNKREFAEYKNRHISDGISSNYNTSRDTGMTSETPDEPYVGMSHKLIDRTGWGPYDEREILKHLRGNLYRYTWYFCEGNRQYMRTVMVKGEVFDVSSPDLGVPIEDIDSRFVKCPK
jgi:hypothetical protein